MTGCSQITQGTGVKNFYLERLITPYYLCARALDYIKLFLLWNCSPCKAFNQVSWLHCPKICSTLYLIDHPVRSRLLTTV